MRLMKQIHVLAFFHSNYCTKNPAQIRMTYIYIHCIGTKTNSLLVTRLNIVMYKKKNTRTTRFIVVCWWAFILYRNLQ